MQKTASSLSIQNPVHSYTVGSQEPEIQHLLLDQEHSGDEGDIVEIQDMVNYFIYSESVSK